MEMLEDYASNVDHETAQQSRWFVYLLPLLNCSSFKVGFSSNPLQRIYSFNHRYFERFDFDQAVLLQMDSCVRARSVEAALKKALAEFGADAPHWVRVEAGGHTEWFNSVAFVQAEEQLRSFAKMVEPTRLIMASDFIVSELTRLTSPFEEWALQQAHAVRDDMIAVALGYEPTVSIKLLRDWFDAYRFFKIGLFRDDPAVLELVANSARQSLRG
jgi:hypothetical protein